MDGKGRIGLPTRYHAHVLDKFHGKFVVTVDIHKKCLALYPLPEWEEIAARLSKLPTSNPAMNTLKRRIIGHATDVIMDSTGRLLLSPELRSVAGLEKEVVLVGLDTKCEIWNKADWDAEQQAAMTTDFSAADFAEAIDSLAL